MLRVSIHCDMPDYNQFFHPSRAIALHIHLNVPEIKI